MLDTQLDFSPRKLQWTPTWVKIPNIPITQIGSHPSFPSQHQIHPEITTVLTSVIIDDSWLFLKFL